jgi:U4/U6.U5 tri-snRNP-associated protein 1
VISEDANVYFFSAAPQVTEFLDTPQLSKNKSDRKGKKKEQIAAVDVPGSRGGTGTPDPQSASVSAPPTAISPAPMMKPSFARITASSEPVSGIPTPTNTVERTKLSIGLKRKADTDGGPNAKRR